MPPGLFRPHRPITPARSGRPSLRLFSGGCNARPDPAARPARNRRRVFTKRRSRGLAYRSYNMPGRDPRWLDRYPRFELSFVPSFEVTALDEASWQELCAGMASAGRSMKEARPAFRQAEADSLAARIGADRYAAWTAAQGTYRAWFDPLLILDPDSRFNRRARRTNDPILFRRVSPALGRYCHRSHGRRPGRRRLGQRPPIRSSPGPRTSCVSWKSKLPRDLQMAVSDADRESYLETIKERWRAHQLAVEEIRAEADARRPPDQVARPLPSSGMEHKKTIRLLEAAMAAAHDDLMLSLGGEPAAPNCGTGAGGQARAVPLGQDPSPDVRPRHRHPKRAPGPQRQDPAPANWPAPRRCSGCSAMPGSTRSGSRPTISGPAVWDRAFATLEGG